MLLSLRATIEFCLLLAVLPALVLLLLAFSKRRGKSSVQTAENRDLLVARISSLFIVIGFITLAFSSHVIPAIFGKFYSLFTFTFKR